MHDNQILHQHQLSHKRSTHIQRHRTSPLRTNKKSQPRQTSGHRRNLQLCRPHPNKIRSNIHLLRLYFTQKHPTISHNPIHPNLHHNAHTHIRPTTPTKPYIQTKHQHATSRTTPIHYNTNPQRHERKISTSNRRPTP